MRDRDLGRSAELSESRARSNRLVLPTVATLALLAAACGFGIEKKGEETGLSVQEPVATATGLVPIEPPTQVPTATMVVQATTTSVEGELSEVQAVRVGEKAPDFELPTLDGQTVRLSDFAGRPVILFYWGASFGASNSDLEKLIGIRDRYIEQGLVLLTVALEKGVTGPIKDKISPILLDEGRQPSLFDKLYKIQGYPQAYFIGRNGIVLGLSSGKRSEGGLTRDTEDLLNGKLIERSRIDRSGLQLPLSEATFGMDQLFSAKLALGESQAISSSDSDTVYNILDEVDILTGEAEELNMPRILELVNEAGRLLRDNYCTGGGDQSLFDAWSTLAAYVADRLEYYIEERVLPEVDWDEFVNSFNPTCELRHFPTH